MKEGVVMGGINFVSSLVDMEFYKKLIDYQARINTAEDRGYNDLDLQREYEEFLKSGSLFRINKKVVSKESVPKEPESILDEWFIGLWENRLNWVPRVPQQATGGYEKGGIRNDDGGKIL